MDSEIIAGDNLEVMRSLPSESVDLIATDPPFNTGRDFGEYDDAWGWGPKSDREYESLAPEAQIVASTAKRLHSSSMGAYLCFLAVRVAEMHRLLKPSGSLYLHCDTTANSYIRLMLDAIFGARNFRNEIVWSRAQSGKKSATRFGRSTDRILFYARSSSSEFNAPYSPGSTAHYRYDDGDGRLYSKDSTAALQDAPQNKFDYKGYPPPAKGWRYRRETMDRLDGEGLLAYPKSPKGRILRKRYLSDYKGVAASDLWMDVNSLRPVSSESMGYPTQKPVGLYERIVSASSPEGGVVLDPFCGSGTTLVAARNLGRSYIGIDANPEAVQITERRIAGALL